MYALKNVFKNCSLVFQGQGVQRPLGMSPILNIYSVALEPPLASTDIGAIGQWYPHKTRLRDSGTRKSAPYLFRHVLLRTADKFGFPAYRRGDLSGSLSGGGGGRGLLSGQTAPDKLLLWAAPD
jgi:hypothetical protein